MNTQTRNLIVASFGVCVAAFSQVAAADDWQITYEKPGVQNSTASFKLVGVETFDKQSAGLDQSFSTNFGLADGAIQGKYSSVQIAGADQYGGAGGVGNYAVAFPSTPYQLTLTKTPDDKGVNYFGYWLSALDPGNTVTFYKGDKQVGVFDASKVSASISGLKNYAGNPNEGPLKGKNAGEPYAFVNFYDTNGSFDRIAFSEVNFGGGYESDNHTVGLFNGVAPNVPEPETYALMLAGVAAIGLKTRRRRSATQA